MAYDSQRFDVRIQYSGGVKQFGDMNGRRASNCISAYADLSIDRIRELLDQAIANGAVNFTTPKGVDIGIDAYEY